MHEMKLSCCVVPSEQNTTEKSHFRLPMSWVFCRCATIDMAFATSRMYR